MGSKKLVVFYSFEGSTRLLAEIISKELNADILECKPIKDMKSKGLSKYFWGGTQVVTKKMPDLVEFLVDPNDYEAIIIGTPVWAYTYSPAIRTFLSQVKLRYKKIALNGLSQRINGPCGDVRTKAMVTSDG